MCREAERCGVVFNAERQRRREAESAGLGATRDLGKPAGRGAVCDGLGRGPVGGPVNKFPARQRRLAPASGGAFLASPDWESRRSAGQKSLGKSQEGLKPGSQDFFQDLFRGAFVSREAGFPIGWRRCNASLRRGRGRMRACTQIRQRPAGRGRSAAPPLVFLVARSAIRPNEDWESLSILDRNASSMAGNASPTACHNKG